MFVWLDGWLVGWLVGCADAPPRALSILPPQALAVDLLDLDIGEAQPASVPESQDLVVSAKWRREARHVGRRGGRGDIGRDTDTQTDTVKTRRERSVK